MKRFFFRSRSVVLSMWLAIAALLLSKATVATAASDGECSSSSTQFHCPNPDACPESGYSLVSACLDCEGYLSSFYEEKQCFDRKLLSPKGNPSETYFWRDLIGVIVWFVSAGVATACGVGGGGIYVPLGILLLGFAPKPSSGLSQASIFGASVGGLILNIKNRHPCTYKVTRDANNAATTTSATPGANTTDNGTEIISSVPTVDDTPENTGSCHYYTRPLIDYDMALFLAPMEMAGAVLGVLIQTILPNWLYLMIASLILAFTAYKTYGKWWETRKKEKAIAEEHTASGETAAEAAAPQSPSQNGQEPFSSKQDPPSPEIPLLELRHHDEQPADGLEGPRSTDLTYKTDDNSHSDEEHQAARRQDSDAVPSEDDIVHDLNAMDAEKIARRDFLLERDARQYPAEKLFVFFILWVGLTLLTFFKGGKGVDSLVGITCEDTWYGVLIAIQFLWTFGFAAYFAWKLLKDTEEKQSVGYPFHPQDVLWDFQKTRFYAFFTFVAGIVAGLIGIGGGMVLGPLMLVMGIHPRVSTATTATMIVLTSSSVAVLFVTSGLVPWEYAVCFFCVCFIGAFIGKTYIDGYVKKTGKASILIFLLATIIAFATVGTLVIVFTRLADANWCFAGFNKFCSISHDDQEVTCAPADARMLQQSFFTDVVGSHQF